MVSIRRTLSPVPRPGTLMNGEACLVGSPLSKSSLCNQDSSTLSGSPSSTSSEYGIYKFQAFLLGLFSQRSWRPLERTKLKGQGWRRSIFHILICFCVGIFVGITPFVSMNSSTNFVSEDQDFSFKKFSVAPENETTIEDGLLTRNETIIEDGLLTSNDSVPLELDVVIRDIENGTSTGTVVSLSVDQDSFEVFHKLLIIVTPTYARPFQAYYLNRLAYTLKLLPPPLLWIVVEMNSQSLETANTLTRTGVMYRHLVCNKNLTGLKYRSLHQRNVALSHIEKHQLDGIVYFADDANIYSTELFELMRQIRRFGTWPVAKLVPVLSQTTLEGPICNGTRVIGWHSKDLRRRFRRFHVQMSGFAFNSTILWDPKRWHRHTLQPIRQLDTVKEEFQVSTFIEQVVEDESQMEGLPLDCSKVMVWQLRIEPTAQYSYPPQWLMKNNLDAIFPHISKV